MARQVIVRPADAIIVAMTGRERVRRCIEFDRPDRVPRDVWVLPIAAAEHGQPKLDDLARRWPTDFGGPGVAQPALAALMEGKVFEVGQYRDEWGCVFENIQAGVQGEVKQPIVDDFSKLDRLRPPVEALDLDIEAVNRACAASEQFVLCGCCPRPFERAQFIRGSENLLMDLAEEPAELHELLRILHDFFCKEFEVWVRTDVDAMRIMDDWGSQLALLTSPAQWRRIFKPMYADYVRIAHDAGKKLFMHSDGHIFEVYEDLIEIGVDVINSQLFCMDIDQIGRRYKGRITFWGEIDRQHVLAHGTPADARAAVQRVVDNLYDPAGGVIAQFELGCATKIENAHAVFQAWQDLTATT